MTLSQQIVPDKIYWLIMLGESDYILPVMHAFSHFIKFS